MEEKFEYTVFLSSVPGPYEQYQQKVILYGPIMTSSEILRRCVDKLKRNGFHDRDVTMWQIDSIETD